MSSEFAPPETAPPETVHFVQITDTHIVASAKDGMDPSSAIDPAARLREAIRLVNAETPVPTAVILTGDLTNDAQPAEYEALAELLTEFEPPLYAVGGNHDDRDAIRSLFGHLDWVDADHASWVARHNGVWLVGLDTSIPGHPGAEFDDERAVWLEGVLARARAEGGPVLLAMHHPPFLTGIGWMDASGFIGRERFVEIVAAHRVDRILCGHLHRPMNAVVGGTIAQVGLSTVQHVALNFTADARHWLINDPVGYLIHRYDQGVWVTHTRYFDTGQAPYLVPR